MRKMQDSPFRRVLRPASYSMRSILHFPQPDV